MAGRVDPQMARLHVASLTLFTLLLVAGTAVGDARETLVWERRDFLRGSPPVRTSPAATYDTLRRRFVLFGGANATFRDTWEWDGSAWQQFHPTTTPETASYYVMAFDEARGRSVLVPASGSAVWEWDGIDWRRVPIAGVEYDRDADGTADCVTTNAISLSQNVGVSYDSALRRIVLMSDRTTFEWDGSTWRAFGLGSISLCWPADAGVAPEVPEPELLRRIDLAFDAKRQVTVYVGDTAQSSPYPRVLQTWERRGRRWLRVGTSAVAVPDRERFALVYDARLERTLLVGGGATATEQREVWAWDGVTWTTLADPTPLGPRVDVASAYDGPRERAYFFGGFRPGSRNDLWSWGASGWRLESPCTSPPPLIGQRLVYDEARRVSVMFGGSNTGLSSETWEWDGVSWIERESPTAPTGRDSHAMAYDARRQRVVVFGGNVGMPGTTLASDTWEWNGSTWTELHPVHSPPALRDASMAFDPARQKNVLFGGQASSDESNETWEWDGNDWTKISSLVAPPARSGAGMAYDGARQKTILFGGSQHTDLWSWDGRWTEISPSTSLPPLRAAAAFHRVRGRIVYCLESNAFDALIDTWELSEQDLVHHAITPAPFAYGTSTAYDAARVRVVAHSGWAAETWELRAAGGPCTQASDCDEGLCQAGRCASRAAVSPADGGAVDASEDHASTDVGAMDANGTPSLADAGDLGGDPGHDTGESTAMDAGTGQSKYEEGATDPAAGGESPEDETLALDGGESGDLEEARSEGSSGGCSTGRAARTESSGSALALLFLFSSVLGRRRLNGRRNTCEQADPRHE